MNKFNERGFDVLLLVEMGAMKVVEASLEMIVRRGKLQTNEMVEKMFPLIEQNLSIFMSFSTE